MPIEPATLGAFIVPIPPLVISPGPYTFLVLRYPLAARRYGGLPAFPSFTLGLSLHLSRPAARRSRRLASAPVLL